jgi:hypothetical protein
MVCQPLRLALLIGAITAVAVSPASASFRAPRSNCCDPCGPSAGTTAPATRTVSCTEWVRETYQVKRTAYRVECRTETYDSCRWESFPVCKERTVCVTKRVPVYREECRKVCENVTTWETRTVNKTSYKYVQETCMKKQLVRLGHWECREVCPLFGGLGGGRGGLFSGHHGNACGDACGNNGCNDPCADNCRPTRTRKVWVSCPEYRECPVTVCKKVAVCEPVTCKVAVCTKVWKEVKVKVCTYQCVTENVVQKYTCYERRQVPCKATRTVRVCVPYEVCETRCKMVPRTVTRTVTDCAPACTTTCNDNCCERGGLFSGLRGRLGCGFGGGFGHRDCNRGSCCN